MREKLKVYFTAGDGINWAVDEDLALLKTSLNEKVIESNFVDANIVFASWWAPLSLMDKTSLRDKYVVCNMHGDPYRFLSTPSHKDMFDLVDLWFSRSKAATRTLVELGYFAEYVPYSVNNNKFSVLPHPLEMNSPIVQSISELKEKYLIGSFMRDSEGDNLLWPKLVKGPDLLLEIYRECIKRGLPVMLVIGGPRRHWLIDQLKKNELPYHYLGVETSTDDISKNIFDRAEINLFYNLVDLTIVSSRSEGGPLVLCEAPLANCKIISTPVGMSRDVLDESLIFHSVNEAVNLIQADLLTNKLEKSLKKTQTKLALKHQPEMVGDLILNSFYKLQKLNTKRRGLSNVPKQKGNILQKLIKRGQQKWNPYLKQKVKKHIWVGDLSECVYERSLILEAIEIDDHLKLSTDIKNAELAIFDILNDTQYVFNYNSLIKKIALVQIVTAKVRNLDQL